MPAALRVLVLVSAHPKLRSFVRLCAWFILSLGPKPPLAHYPAFIVCLATTSLLESIHKWKNPKMWLLRTCTCPRFRKTRSLSHQRSPGPGLVLSRGIMRFTPPLCDYSRSPSTWDLQFSSASQLGASTRILSFGLSSKLKKKEPSFKEFLASPAMRFSFKELSL